MKKLFFVLLFGLFSCGSPAPNDSHTITVSIDPLRYITEQIVGTDFTIHVLVPKGSSPETFEPTPSQMKQVANSSMYVSVGLLDFEANLGHSIEDNMPDVKQVKLSEGVELIAGSCNHANEDSHENENGHGHEHHHTTGVDPHIWSSPKVVRQMATTLYQAIATAYPDSTHYKSNYEHLIARLDSLDTQLTTLFAARSLPFMIYHPALTYLARDYGLTQIALENEGKEPAAEHVRTMIDTARALKIKRLFYQNQFSQNTVEALSRELGIPAVAIDPLAKNLIDNTLEIATLIAQP